MNLILFGFKGSGKTHFGKLLALQMNRPFIDTDNLVAEIYFEETGKKKKVREIYEEVGEESFRQLEKKAILFLKKIGNAIIAVGGGTVLDPSNVELLVKTGSLVYLKADAEKIRKRIFQEELPAFFNKSHPEESFRQMFHDREPIYRSVPARTIDTDALDEAGVIAALRSILLLEDPPNGL
jgi:shikimate kinase